MTLCADYPAADFARTFEVARPTMKLRAAVRYTGVLAVWAGLFLIRPKLALEIFHNRRPDSPIPRRRR